MRKVTKEDLKKGLEVRWYMHGRKYVIEDIKNNTVKFRGFDYFMLDSVLDNCYVPKSKVMRFTSNAWKFLTQWKNYNVTDGKSGYYDLLDDNAVMVTVSKSLFEEPSLQREVEEFANGIRSQIHDYCKEAFGEHRDTMLSPQMQCRSVFAQIRCRGRSQKAIDALNAEKSNIKPTTLPMERCKLVGVKYDQIGGTHYNKNDPIQFARDNYSPEQLEGFFRINVDKYVARYPDKNGLEDLYKAKHYLDMLIDLKEKQDAK